MLGFILVRFLQVLAKAWPSLGQAGDEAGGQTGARRETDGSHAGRPNLDRAPHGSALHYTTISYRGLKLTLPLLQHYSKNPISYRGFKLQVIQNATT